MCEGPLEKERFCLDEMFQPRNAFKKFALIL